MIDVTRSAEAPPSLAAGVRYDGADVVERLHADFLGKCYLCETPIEPGTFTIDHRRPKGEDQFRHLQCSWTNLFPACNTHRCNERRRKKYPPEGLLDPAAGDRVEQRVIQRITSPSAVLAAAVAQFSFEPSSRADAPAVSTAEELDRIHNGKGSSPPAERTARALRATILRHAQMVAEKLERLKAMEQSGDEPAKVDASRAELRKLLSRRAPYTMLIRSCFAGQPAAQALFD